MSSTLVIRKTPKRTKAEWSFKLPVKALIARKFYDHDGSCGGGEITIGPEHLEWFEGVLAAGNFEPRDRKDLESVVQILRDGDTIDMWV
jgi:hypothetical protein